MERPEEPPEGTWEGLFKTIEEMAWPLFVLLAPGSAACLLYNLLDPGPTWRDTFLIGLGTSLVWLAIVWVYDKVRYGLGAMRVFGHVRPPWR